MLNGESGTRAGLGMLQERAGKLPGGGIRPREAAWSRCLPDWRGGGRQALGGGAADELLACSDGSRHRHIWVSSFCGQLLPSCRNNVRPSVRPTMWQTKETVDARAGSADWKPASPTPAPQHPAHVAAGAHLPAAAAPSDSPLNNSAAATAIPPNPTKHSSRSLARRRLLRAIDSTPGADAGDSPTANLAAPPRELQLPKQKSGRFDPGSVSENMKNKMFGRQKTLHGVLGGGKSADVLLWRNKKISSSVLGLATVIWVFFEWLDYHFLTIISFALVLGMVVQFVWSNFSKSSDVPRVKLPEDLFVNIAVAIGAQVNKFLGFLQDVSCERNLKHFVLAIVGLWAASVAGSWFNLLTVIYIGFVCAHTLPVLYEKYEDQVDDFLYNILGLLRDQYQKLDSGVLRRIPKGNKKSE
ncbi:hypothetical protein ZWY2020_017870 [Hordeum vulgare]|nr:hypothetical protein ZWY2020_017870 [Hordeum vulgare]